jgi:hypothetical protein
MKSVGQWIARGVTLFVASLLLAGCSDLSKIRGTLRHVGSDKLRAQTLAVCREGFAAGSSTKIDAARWPESARAFKPLGLWPEPDGAYLLIDSDADGERGIYLPRILSEKDPLCSAKLTHVKLGEGVYWYDRKRS